MSSTSLISGTLGAANALIDPAHDITQYSLGIVFEFADHRPLGYLAVAEHGNRQNLIQTGLKHVIQLSLPGEHTDVMVVHGVERGRHR